MKAWWCKVSGYKPMRVQSLKLDGETVELLERLAKKLNTTKSELIRRAITEYVAQRAHYLEQGEDQCIETSRVRVC